jgi:hypothetical protein
MAAVPPESTKASLAQRLNNHARTHWPAIDHVQLRFRGRFAYIDAALPNGVTLALCRLRYGGYASEWGFAIYRASHDDYQDNVLPTGWAAGTPEEALDCAAGLYLSATWPDDPTPTN